MLRKRSGYDSWSALAIIILGLPWLSAGAQSQDRIRNGSIRMSAGSLLLSSAPIFWACRAMISASNSSSTSGSSVTRRLAHRRIHSRWSTIDASLTPTSTSPAKCRDGRLTAGAFISSMAHRTRLTRIHQARINSPTGDELLPIPLRCGITNRSRASAGT